MKLLRSNSWRALLRAQPQLITLEERTTPTTVTNLNDSGVGSLRQALINNSATIDFQAGLAGTITLTSGYLQVNTAVTITGPGADVITVKGNNASTVFFSTISSAVSLSGLTISGGVNGLRFNGGPMLTLTNCVISGNSGNLSTDRGGGIYMGSGTLSLQNCVISNNNSGGGAGIYMFGNGRVIAQNSTFTGNASLGRGGAICFNFGGSLLLENSTLWGNTAGVNGVSNTGGGGLYFEGTATAAGLIVRNSTIVGNSSAANGGGIDLSNFTGTLTVQNSTIAANSAASTGAGDGGGIAKLGTGTGTIALESTIVAGNTAQFRPDIYSAGTVTMKTSAVGSGSGFSQTNLGGNLAYGAVLNLGPLADNGGPTKTRALLPGSQCLDVGSNPNALTTDQRGPGFLRQFGSQVDIGAFEYAPIPAKIVSIVINANSTQRSRLTMMEVNFDQVVTFTGGAAAAFTLSRQSDSNTVTLNAIVDNTSPGTKVALSFTGGAVDGTSLADGRYTLTALANQFTGAGLDGDGDGTPGDNYQLIGTPANGLFRLFGDSTGDGTVNGTDFLAFRLAFMSTDAAFDFDGDGQVTGTDFLQFRLRFLMTV